MASCLAGAVRAFRCRSIECLVGLQWPTTEVEVQAGNLLSLASMYMMKNVCLPLSNATTKIQYNKHCNLCRFVQAAFLDRASLPMLFYSRHHDQISHRSPWQRSGFERQMWVFSMCGAKGKIDQIMATLAAVLPDCRDSNYHRHPPRVPPVQHTSEFMIMGQQKL